MERNGLTRCITDLPEETIKKMEAAMKANGYASRSNFIRSVVEKSLNSETETGSDTTYVSKHVVNVQYRNLMDEYQTRTKELEQELQQKERQINLLSGTVAAVVFAQNAKEGTVLSSDEIKKVFGRVINLIDSEDGIDSVGVVEVLEQIASDMKANGQTVAKAVKPVTERSVEQSEEPTLSFSFNSPSKVSAPTTRRESFGLDNNEPKDNGIAYHVKVSDRDWSNRIHDGAIRPQVVKFANNPNSFNNVQGVEVFKRASVFFDTIEENPVAHKLLHATNLGDNVSKEERDDIKELQDGYWLTMFYIRVVADGIDAARSSMPGRYDNLSVGDLTSTVIMFLNRWSDEEGHFVDARRAKAL